MKKSSEKWGEEKKESYVLLLKEREEKGREKEEKYMSHGNML